VQNASATETVQAILALTDYTLSLNFGRSPTQGQFVITGAQAGGPLERRIGFCVQIRKKCGQFGSDLLFLRHPSGELVTAPKTLSKSVHARFGKGRQASSAPAWRGACRPLTAYRTVIRPYPGVAHRPR
jgi:hypothetical protein